MAPLWTLARIVATAPRTIAPVIADGLSKHSFTGTDEPAVRRPPGAPRGSLFPRRRREAIRDDAPHTAPTILTVPGLGGSGDEHWQTLWERASLDIHRVELGLWDAPDRAIWVRRLDGAIRDAGAPVVLVGHSLGCLAIAWWAVFSEGARARPIAGALLVSPPDVDREDAAPEIAGFAPAPMTPLPFPSIMVASEDDPWIAAPRARALASRWGSHFVDVGALGHINAASGVGAWAEGRALLGRLLAAIAAGATTPAAARAMLAAALDRPATGGEPRAAD